MKKSLFALAAMASLGLFAFGCGDGESGDSCLTGCAEGLACNAKLECQPIDDCYANNGNKFCKDDGLVCQPSNGKCVEPAAETCQTTGCPDKFTCVEDDQGAWACMPDDQKCYNNTVWSSVAEMCVDADSESCEDGANESCSGEGKTVCDPDLKLCVPRQVSSDPKPYKYVKIEDLSPAQYADKNVEDPGVDIDAIVLTKKNSGEKIHAASVVGYARGDGQSSVESRRAFVPDEALGEPDSFVSYPNDMTNCNYYKGTVPAKDAPDEDYVYTFVSLGGVGGYLIVGMGGNIEEGDTLDVIELSDCKLANTQSSNGKDAVAEKDGMEVQVSASKKVDGDWVFITSGTATAGILSETIPALVEVPDDGQD